MHERASRERKEAPSWQLPFSIGEGSRAALKGAQREQIDEIGFSAGAKWRSLDQLEVSCCPKFGETMIYTYMISILHRFNE